MSSRHRPEHQAPPDVFYDNVEAYKYATSSRMIEIQTEMSERAIELLALPDGLPCLLLDIGCGSGLSGDCLTEQGHEWIGIDISKSMINIALKREVEGDMILSDAGEGLFFRPGIFDGAISVSALQWLCNADKKSHNPQKRLYRFFSSLYATMKHGSRAVFQVYPETPQQLELITSNAVLAGFGGGVVIDYPNSTKAKKIFLCLFCGVTPQTLPKGLDDSDRISTTKAYFSKKKSSSLTHIRKPLKGSRDWIEEKKSRRRRKGKDVRPNSKYSGRKRKVRF